MNYITRKRMKEIIGRNITPTNKTPVSEGVGVLQEVQEVQEVQETHNHALLTDVTDVNAEDVNAEDVTVGVDTKDEPQHDDNNIHRHPVMQLAALLNEITTTLQTDEGFYEDEVQKTLSEGLNLITTLDNGQERAAMRECLSYLSALLKLMNDEESTFEELYVTYFYALNHIMRAGDEYDQYLAQIDAPDIAFGYDEKLVPDEIPPEAVLAWRQWNTQKTIQSLHAPYVYTPNATKIEISQRQLSIALNKVINLSQKARGGWVYDWAANLQGVNKLMIQALADAELIKRSGNKFTLSVTMSKLPNWFVYKTLDVDSIYEGKNKTQSDYVDGVSSLDNNDTQDAYSGSYSDYEPEYDYTNEYQHDTYSDYEPQYIEQPLAPPVQYTPDELQDMNNMGLMTEPNMDVDNLEQEQITYD